MAQRPLHPHPFAVRTGMPSPLGAAWTTARHRAFQESRLDEDPAYRIEVPLEATLEHRGWQVTLHGRADGLVPGGVHGDWLVEEVKTGLGAWDEASTPARCHAFQVALYAWMLSRLEHVEVTAQVIWLPLGGEPEPVVVDVSDAELEERLRAECGRAIELAEAREARRQRRAAAVVDPPYPAWRTGQAELIDATGHAIEHGEQLLVQAPTGSGKTGATLFAAARAALAHDLPVVWVTGRGTQQRLPVELLRRLAPKDLPFAVQFGSMESMCTTGVQWCHPDLCDLAGDQDGRGPDVLARTLARDGVLTRRAAQDAGRDQRVCPYLMSRAARGEVSVVVADFHHLVHPTIRLPGAPGEEPFENAVIIVDEIHQLLDRARDAGSVELDEALVAGAIDLAALGSSPLHHAQREHGEALLRLLRESLDEAGLGDEDLGSAASEADAGELWLPGRLPHEALRRWVETLQELRARSLLERGPAGPGEPDPWSELDRRVGALARPEQAPGARERVGRVRGVATWRRFEVDPAPRLRPLFDRSRAVIGLSATRGPVEPLRDGLGLDPDRCVELTLPSPIPATQRRVVIDPSIDTRFRARARSAPRVAERIASFANAVPGNLLAVFPSHGALAQVHAHLVAPGRWLEAQAPAEDEGVRATRFELLSDRDDVLLLAVAGGLYTEGIDLPGDALLGVLVVGPCLPPPSQERDWIAEHVDEQGRAGHEAAYAVPGIRRVVQAVGRLLRSPEDRGVAALLGRRFLEEPFRSLLPEDWWTDGGPEDHVGDPATEAEDFFRS